MEGTLRVNIDNSEIFSFIEKAASEAVKRANIDAKIKNEAGQEIDKYVKKAIEDGSFYQSVAKNVAVIMVKEMPIDKLVSMIDMSELQNAVAEKIAEKMIVKMK